MKLMGVAGAIACLALSSCGGGGGNATTGTGSGATGASTASATADATGAWNETDACKTLDQAVVASAAGEAVSKAATTKSIPATDSTAALSQCDYTLADGRTVMFSTKVAMTTDMGADAASYADHAKAAGLQPPAPVPGVGKAAFWGDATELPHLDFFVGAHQFGFFMFKGKMASAGLEKVDPAWAKDLAIKLAHKVGA